MANLKEKEVKLVESFICGAKNAFSEKIARIEILNVHTSKCEAGEPAVVRYNVAGSVDTKSPTGKSKIYKYTAAIDLNKENGECALVDLKIDDTQV